MAARVDTRRIASPHASFAGRKQAAKLRAAAGVCDLRHHLRA
eukprot:CAMPEP_0174875614 /NCGR_PEP_ID=MMETSP1114-20130205/78640_1 /TAXON_ID=312471 /ORGANISM="Neobodo designis, Strain CCAP 1951/1" /LENGTH=41 /DNA_ID= /DNA_START= /DNA_END= /DNA_ORIENTATION=